MGSISRISDYVKEASVLNGPLPESEELLNEAGVHVFQVTMPESYKSGRLRHSHQNKRIIVTEGSLVVHLDKGVHRILKDEQILITANRSHRLENFGASALKIIDIRTGGGFSDDQLLTV